MRGGINPLTNEYYTQDEYEDNVQARRNQASIDRIRKTKDLYDTGVIDRDWDQSPLKNRLAGLEEGQWNRMNAMGMPIGTTKPGEEVAEEMIYPERKPFEPPASEYEGMWEDQGVSDDFANARRAMTQVGIDKFRNNPVTGQPNFNRGVYDPYGIKTPTGAFSYDMNYRPGDTSRVDDDVMQRFSLADMGITPQDTNTDTGIRLAGLNKEQRDYLNRIKREGIGSSGYSTFTKSERHPDQMAGAFFEYADPTDVWTDIESLNPKSTNMFSSTVNPEKIVYGDETTFAQPDEVTSYIQSLSPKDKTYSYGLRKNVPGVDYTKPTWAQGGRVEYNTGGRVGILSIF